MFMLAPPGSFRHFQANFQVCGGNGIRGKIGKALMINRSSFELVNTGHGYYFGNSFGTFSYKWSLYEKGKKF